MTRASFSGVRRAARYGAAFLCVALHGAHAAAATLDDYLAHGFAVVAQTTVAGLFSGCRPGVSISFADGSQFACGEVASQHGFDTRAVFLAAYGAPPSVLLIGSRAYSGSLRQLGSHVFAAPVKLGDAAPAGGGGVLPPDPVDVKLSPLNRIDSINALQTKLVKSLNESQADPLPARGPIARK